MKVYLTALYRGVLCCTVSHCTPSIHIAQHTRCLRPLSALSISRPAMLTILILLTVCYSPCDALCCLQSLLRFRHITDLPIHTSISRQPSPPNALFYTPSSFYSPLFALPSLFKTTIPPPPPTNSQAPLIDPTPWGWTWAWTVDCRNRHSSCHPPRSPFG